MTRDRDAVRSMETRMGLQSFRTGKPGAARQSPKGHRQYLEPNIRLCLTKNGSTMTLKRGHRAFIEPQSRNTRNV